ncbi:MAG: hypothetical protein ACI84C_001149 [Flavobacteriales bacterium]|jgi:hypothetical protein
MKMWDGLNNNRGGALLVVCLAVAFLFAFYGQVLLHPNDYSFSASGDGVKNYFTLVSYVDNNESATNFEGLNYPYGESMMFTDCHPIIAVGMRQLVNVFPWMGAYSVGLINFLMLFSFVVGAFFLWRLFRRLDVNPLLSVLGALAIMVLSPQIFRLEGHYALSYACALPITFYLLLNFVQDKHKLKSALFLSLNTLFWFFIHAYLGMIVGATLIAFGLVKIIVSVFGKGKFKGLLYYALATVLPILIFAGVSDLLDSHENRTDNPYGFFEYYADFDTVLLANHPPMNVHIDKFLPNFTQTWEGWSYIGLTAIFCLFAFFYAKLKSKIGNVFHDKYVPIDPFVGQLVFASLIILVFSFGLPFRWGMQDQLDNFPVLKQFRSIGRFAWVFYFVINIGAIVFIQRVFHHLFLARKQAFAFAIMLGAPALMVYEGWAYHVEISESIIKSDNLFDRRTPPDDLREALNFLKGQKYQAIIPMPFYNIGSENFQKEATENSYLKSMVMSYHANIPILGSYLTRTSLCESKKVMQLFSEPYYDKPIQQDIKSDFPFLIVHSRDVHHAHEERIRAMSTLIYDTLGVQLYSIEKEVLFSDKRKWEWQQSIALESEYCRRDGYVASDSTSFVLRETFDHLPSANTFRGKGAFVGKKSKYNYLCGIESGLLYHGEGYEISVWLYNQGENCGQDRLNNLDLVMRQVNADGSESFTTTKPMHSLTIDGDWTKVDLFFAVEGDYKQLDFYLQGIGESEMDIVADEVFIRSQQCDWYKIDLQEFTLFKNNHKITHGN